MMTDYICVGEGAMCVYITVHCIRWDKGTARQKVPTLSHPTPPRTPHVYASKLDFILQKQSGMNKSFSSPCFGFSLFHSLLLSPFTLSFLLPLFLCRQCERFCLSFYLGGDGLVYIWDLCSGLLVWSLSCEAEFKWKSHMLWSIEITWNQTYLTASTSSQCWISCSVCVCIFKHLCISLWIRLLRMSEKHVYVRNKVCV